VKDETGDVFAISGNIAQNMLFAESRLVERNLHAYQADELKGAKVTRGTLSRELVRLEDKKDGWPTRPRRRLSTRRRAIG